MDTSAWPSEWEAGQRLVSWPRDRGESRDHCRNSVHFMVTGGIRLKCIVLKVLSTNTHQLVQSLIRFVWRGDIKALSSSSSSWSSYHSGLDNIMMMQISSAIRHLRSSNWFIIIRNLRTSLAARSLKTVRVQTGRCRRTGYGAVYWRQEMAL